MHRRESNKPTIDELNDNLPTLFPPKCRHNQQRHASPIIVPQGPNEHFDEHSTATAVIHSGNETKQNRHLNKAIIGRMNNEQATVPSIEENIEAVNTAKHFPKLSQLLNGHGTDVLIKNQKEMPDQRTIDSIVDQLNDKINHLYRLPFELATLRNSQRKGAFFALKISYLEDNHLPSNKTRQNIILAEAENYLLFNDLLFHFSTRHDKKENDKFALCIPYDLCNSLFELFHSGRLTSH